MDLNETMIERALRGDQVGIDWVARRFTPLLLAQADYRIGPSLRRFVAPEDVVQDVWLSVLPHLPELNPEEGKAAPTLLRYLGTAVLNRVRQLAEKHLLNPSAREALPSALDFSGSGASRDASLQDSSSGPLSKVIRQETRSEVRSLIGDLEPADREIVVLRGIEQWSLAETATLISSTPNVCAVRFHRALARLRERIPGSVFHDLLDDPPPART